ncbi:MAG: anthranilate phosphoribosyltransferase [Planctomycetota bacterium]
MSVSQPLIDRIIRGENLAQDESATLFESIMTGEVPADAAERVLRALSDRGETVDEIVGAATVLRRHVTRIPVEFPDAIDTCGTGGDGISTFNVSTAAAIVAAAAGAKVAKHGNRSYTRKSGSAEVLTELGVDVDASPAVVARCIREVGIGFLHAARLHPAMARVAEIRRKIGKPTIFNMLGPLTNPAGVRRQIIGVPRDAWIERVALALSKLGTVHAFVVCGENRLCDFTITGPSRYAEIRGTQVTMHEISPSALNMKFAPLESLLVSSPRESAAAIRAVLNGETGPRRDHTLFNSAAALVVAGVAADFAQGLTLATRAIDTGETSRTLVALANASRTLV